MKRLVFPALLLLSLGAHAAVLGWKAVTPTQVDLQVAPEGLIEVAMIEEAPPVPPAPPEPVEIPEPVPPVEPVATPEPPPAPVEEILQASEEVEALPPAPRPSATPPPKPRVATPRPPAQPKVPQGRVVEARPDTSFNPPPSYPEFARRNGWEGSVMIRASVSAEGRVLAVSVARASRYAVLDKAAERAVKSWRFRPRTVGGVAVAAVIEVPVNFTLRR